VNGIRVSIVSILALLLPLAYGETVLMVRGRLESDIAFLQADLTVELQDHSRGSFAAQSTVGNDGSFELRNVPTGLYYLRVVSLRGDIVCEQIVDVLPYTGELTVRLPKRSGSHPGAGTVSVRQLQRPVPEKAFRAVAEAQQDAVAGRGLDAVRKLEHALRIYPDYSDARCNLGVQYVRLGRYREAQEQFEKAAEIGPPSAMLFGNLAFSLCALGRLKDAEQAARRAVALDKSYARGHFLLGSILAKSVAPGFLERAPEAAQHLRLGAADVPHAFIEIAQIYLTEGDRLGAAEELRLYLQSGDRKYRPDVEGWLAKLLQAK
jgi:tetratricopeptide (TPR) repeat protein